MTTFRPFGRNDVPWTALGLGFGLFYGAMFIFLATFWGLEGMVLLLVVGLPFLTLQMIVHIGFDRFSKWRRRNDPPPALTAWARHHSVSIGAAIGCCLAPMWVLSGGIR